MKYPDKKYVSIQNHSNGLNRSQNIHKTSWEDMRGILIPYFGDAKYVNYSEPCSPRQEDQVNKLW